MKKSKKPFLFCWRCGGQREFPGKGAVQNHIRVVHVPLGEVIERFNRALTRPEAEKQTDVTGWDFFTK